MTTYDKTKIFHEVFGHPVEKVATVSDEKTRLLRVNLIAEELYELAEASGIQITIQVGSRDTSIRTYYSPGDNKPDIIGIADALADLDVVVNGGFLVHGLPAEALAQEVFDSNMSKLDENMNPIYNNNGKIQKGPNYRESNIRGVLDKARRNI